MELLAPGKADRLISVRLGPEGTERHEAVGADVSDARLPAA